MTLYQMLLDGSGVLILLLTLIEVTPIKINPWSKIAEKLGKVLSKSVLDRMTTLEKQVAETQKSLNEHIADNKRQKAEDARDAILRFNNELLRNIPHTREEFFEVLRKIDAYEAYCEEHTDFENNRAVHAIRNINRVYDERQINHDFLPEVIS